MKRTFSITLALLLTLVLVLPQQIYAAGTLYVTSVSGKAGDQVTVEVCLTSDDVASGNFYVCYDTACLALVDYAKGDSGYLCAVNEKEAGKIYVSFAQDAPLTETILCRIAFQITADTPATGSALTFQSVRLYNVDAQLVDTTLSFGSVTRDCAWFSLSDADTVEGQGVRAEISLSGALQPCGGSFAVTYDASVLKATGVLVLDGLDNCTVSYNLAEEGVVRIAFAGDAPVENGQLCAIVFQAVGQAGSSTTLELADVRACDENSDPIDTEVFSGTINIVLPSDKAPKLWVVGGSLNDDGTATASILLQGQGKVCGGQFSLALGDMIPAEIQSGAGVEYYLKNDALYISWAKESPSAGAETLITLHFSNAEEHALIFGSDVRVYDSESQQIGVVDIRSGAITKAEQIHLTVDDVEITSTEAGSEVSLTVDLADADYFTDVQTEQAIPMLALYSNGQLQSIVMASDVTFDSGIAEVSLSASSSEPITDYAVFVAGASFAPLCTAITGQ